MAAVDEIAKNLDDAYDPDMSEQQRKEAIRYVVGQPAPSDGEVLQRFSGQSSFAPSPGQMANPNNLHVYFKLATSASDPNTRAANYWNGYLAGRQSGHPDLIDLYLDLAVKDPSPIVRRMAAKILGDYPEFPHSKHWAKGYLHDPDPGVRCEAITSLIRLGGATTDDMLGAILSVMAQSDPDHKVRREAAVASGNAVPCQV